jgi:uncharacterized linocin/CFP29 family protein
MNDLLRDLAPISDAAWKAIDDQARQALTVELAARKLVDFVGPKGWEQSAMNLGRVAALKGAPAEGVTGAMRQVQPLIELRAPFALSRAELENVSRGAADPDLDPLIQASIQIARAEDRAVFHGWAAAGIGGICERTPHKPLKIPDKYEAYPTVVAEAVRTLKMAGVGGPYAIALGPRCYTGLMQAVGHGGFPVLEVVKHVVDGDVVWAPGVDGAVVLSTRGRDFELVVGRDLSIGYTGYDATKVNLYVLESLTFRVLSPEAAVCLRYGR